MKRNLITTIIDVNEFIRHYILHKKECDYCYYFGGCMCDHIDAYGNCLGFKPYTLKNKIQNRRLQRKINKWVEENKDYLKELIKDK